MKKIRIFVIGLLLSISTTGFSQSYVEIGTGTQSTSYPVYSVWNYGWYAFILPQSEIGSAKTITKIAVNCINGPKNYSNQRIYMKHTSLSVFGSASYDDPVSNGYTLVYDGPINYNGWTEISLTTSFAYNGTDNLVIQWENRSGNSLYANFNSTSSASNNNKSSGNDVNFPTSTGTLNPFPSSVPNVRLYYPSSAPATPTNPVPADNDEKTDLNSSLNVTLGLNTSSYDLYFGADSLQVASLNSSFKVIADAVVGAPGVFSFTPPAILTPGTNYFWLVVAKDGASTTNSVVWQFTTQNAIQSFPYFQGFEGSDVFYPGWYGDSTDWTYPASGVNSIWNLCSASNAHSGLAGLSGSPNSGTTTSSIVTPRIFLPANYRVSFWWRNGDYMTLKTANTDTTYFEISTNGGSSWITLDFLSAASAQTTMTQITEDLSAYAGNNVYLRWRYQKAASGADNIYIDDVQIEAIPTGAVIELNTNTIDFQPIYQNAYTSLEVIITNSGIANLDITGVTVSAPFTCGFSGSIAPGTSDTAVVFFDGAVVGNYNTSLAFNHNGSGIGNASVSGVVKAPFGNFNQTFESVAVGTIPAEWSQLNSGNPLHRAEVKNSPLDAYSAPNVVKMYNNSDTVTPLILLTPGVYDFDINTLEFYASKTYGNVAPVSLIVGLMDDPYSAVSFDTVQIIMLNDTMTHYSLTFNSSNTKPYIAFRHGMLDQTQSIWIDNVKWEGVVSDVPGSATLVFPANNSIDNETELTMKWAPSTGAPTGYKLFFGTNNPPTNLLNNVDLGDTLQYAVQNLTYSTTYFWKLVPYNAFGDALNCPVWSYTVMNDPTLYVPWNEDFENTVQTSGYDKPLGWKIINGNDQFMGWDLLANSAMSPDNAHSGNFAMHTGFTFLNPLEDWLITPPVMLTGGTDYTFSFWLKSPYYIESGDTTHEKFMVKWGSQQDTASLNQIIYSNSFLREPDYIYVENVVSPTTTGKYYFGFRTYSDPLQWLVIVDDVAMDYANALSEDNIENIQIYPNPASDYVVLHIKNAQQNSKGSVFDAFGKEVLTFDASTEYIKIDVRSLNSGLYFIQTINTNGESNGRFIVQ